MAELQAPFGLNHTTADPADTRTVKATLADRDAIPATSRPPGLFCYVVSENKTYQLVGGIDNSNWIVSGNTFDDIGKYYQAKMNFSVSLLDSTGNPYTISALGAGTASFRPQGTGDTSPIVSPVRLNGYGRVTLNSGTGVEHITIGNYSAGLGQNNLYAQFSNYLYGYSWIGIRQNWALQNSVATITGFINQNGWTFTNGYQTRSSGYYFYIFPNSGDPNNTFRYQIIASAGSGFTTTVTPASNTLIVGTAYLFEVVLNLTAATPYAEYFINGVSVGVITTNINVNSVLNHIAIGSSRFTGTGSGTTYFIDCGFAGFRQKYLTPIPFSNFYLNE